MAKSANTENKKELHLWFVKYFDRIEKHRNITNWNVGKQIQLMTFTLLSVIELFKIIIFNHISYI
jgi:hypothetical protein